MARWKPSSSGIVAPNEHVGRRLFDEPMLKGATEQPSYGGLVLRHFEEKREKGFSLDRLGRTGVEKSAKKYLLPRVEHAGKKFQKPKTFDGWAVLKAKILMSDSGDIPNCAGPVVASPVFGDELEENLHHADFVMPDGVDHYTMALHLRHFFTTQGTIEPSPRHKSESIWALFQTWFKRKFF